MPLLRDPILSPEDRNRVFEVWYVEAGRSPKATAALCKELFGYDLRPDTISEWSRAHDWHQRANSLLATIAPGMKVEMLSNLLVAGVRASRHINEMLVDASNGKKLDGAATKLAIETMHLAGFSPIGTRNPLDAQRSATVDRNRLLELYHDDDEIKSLMESGRKALEAQVDYDEIQVAPGAVDVDFRKLD